jgi:hypothetical protein
MRDEPLPGSKRPITFISPPQTCNFCGVQFGQKGEFYDYVMKFGKWAYGCEECYHLTRLHPTLGVGKGQKWVQRGTNWVKEQPKEGESNEKEAD